MFNRPFLYLVIATVLFFSGCLITGKVVDENGVGLAGITVTLRGDDSREVLTDSEGKYRFGNLLASDMIPAGSYTVTPSGSGCSFAPPFTDVTITTGVLGELGDVPWPESGVDFILNNCTSDVTLVTLGNSLTAGDGDDQGNGFPMRVREMMQAAGHIVALNNLGVSGWTSGDLVIIETWEDGAGPFYEAQSILLQAESEGQIPIACLWIGSNDAFGLYSWVCDEYPTNCEAENLREFEENLDILLSSLADTGAIVFVALLDDQSRRPMFGPGGEGFYGITTDELDDMSAQIVEYNKIITTLAGQYNAHLVDFYNSTIFETPELIFDDGNHPNGEGYAAIAQVWWNAISPYLSSR